MTVATRSRVTRFITADSLTETVPAEVKESTIFVRDVPLDKMFVHYRTLPGGYARLPTMSRVKKLVQEWETDAAGVLLLSLRDDGTFAIIDGEHRWEGAKKVGVKTLPGFVYIDLSVQDEAKLYSRFGAHLAQKPMDRFHASLSAGDETAKKIFDVLAERSLIVPNAPGQAAGRVQAVEVLMSLYRNYGEKILRQTIAVLHDAYGDASNAYTGNNLRGTAAFIIRYFNNPDFRRPRLIEVMQRNSLAKITGKATSMREGLNSSDFGSSWGRALLFYYNHDLRTLRLPSWPEYAYSETGLAKKREDMAGNVRGARKKER